MADLNDLAQELFGSGRTSGSEKPDVSVMYGTAKSDSYNGTVRVEVGTHVTQPNKPTQIGAYEAITFAQEASYTFNDFVYGLGNVVEMPTSPVVKTGDDVAITLVGNTAMKQPYVSSVIGSGDRTIQQVHEEIQQTETRITSDVADKTRELLDPFEKKYDEFVKNHTFTDDEISKTLDNLVDGYHLYVTGQVDEASQEYKKELDFAVSLDSLKATLKDQYVDTSDPAYKYVQENQSQIEQTVKEISATVEGSSSLTDAIGNIATRKAKSQIAAQYDSITSTVTENVENNISDTYATKQELSSEIKQTSDSVTTTITSITSGNSTYTDLDGNTKTNTLSGRVNTANSNASNANANASAALQTANKILTYFQETSDGLAIYKSNGLVRVFLSSDGKYILQTRSSTSSSSWKDMFSIYRGSYFTSMQAVGSTAKINFYDNGETIDISAQTGFRLARTPDVYAIGLAWGNDSGSYKNSAGTSGSVSISLASGARAGSSPGRAIKALLITYKLGNDSQLMTQYVDLASDCFVNNQIILSGLKYYTYGMYLYSARYTISNSSGTWYLTKISDGDGHTYLSPGQGTTQSTATSSGTDHAIYIVSVNAIMTNGF